MMLTFCTNDKTKDRFDTPNELKIDNIRDDMSDSVRFMID